MENKKLYFRQCNTIGYTNYVIIGDETEEGGRDSAYSNKGTIKQIANAGILSVDGKNDEYWPRIFNDIELNENASRDYDVHEFIKNDSNCQKLCVWTGEKGDKNNPLNTREGFKIYGTTKEEITDNINLLYELICNYLNNNIIRKERKPYIDTIETIKFIIKVCKGKINPHIVSELAPRYGKTQFGINLFSSSDAKILVLSGYVSTIYVSYLEVINHILGYEHIKMFNPDNRIYKDDPKKLIKDMRAWLDSDVANRAIYYLALTGTTTEDKNGNVYMTNDDSDISTFERRYKPFSALMNDYYFALNTDEVDFGAHCKKQINKLKLIGDYKNCIYKISMTGTDANKAEAIWPHDCYISRDYFDMLKIV